MPAFDPAAAERAYGRAVSAAVALGFPAVYVHRATFGPGPERYLAADDLLDQALAGDHRAAVALIRLADELDATGRSRRPA